MSSSKAKEVNFLRQFVEVNLHEMAIRLLLIIACFEDGPT